MDNNIKYRPAGRDAFCRGCDKVLHKGDMLVSMLSYRNRGQYIYLCKCCAEKIQQLMHDHDKLK